MAPGRWERLGVSSAHSVFLPLAAACALAHSHSAPWPCHIKVGSGRHKWFWGWGMALKTQVCRASLQIREQSPQVESSSCLPPLGRPTSESTAKPAQAFSWLLGLDPKLDGFNQMVKGLALAALQRPLQVSGSPWVAKQRVLYSWPSCGS